MLWFSQVFENINIADRNYITEMDFLKLVFACKYLCSSDIEITILSLSQKLFPP